VKLGTVRGKMIANSALILCIVSAATLYTGLASSELSRSVETLFRDNLLMKSLGETLDKTETSLAGYLTTKSTDSLKDYIRYSTRLSAEARKLNREVRDEGSLLLQRNLVGLLDGYLRDAEASVKAKRGRDVAGYSGYFESSERYARHARSIILKIEGMFLDDSLRAYSEFNYNIPAVLASNIALVLSATLMSFTLLVRVSYKITDPLSKLARAAGEIGRGEYGGELPLPQSDDEIGTMASAFESMRESVRKAFEELKSKSEIERRLMEERMRVLDMDHKLKDAELLALQTQINPHFLFNTLSAGMGLALSEGADRTGDFLENLAEFIRYVLKPPSRSVFVSDEIECVERYIWLLGLRFGDRFRFEVHADEEVLGVECPALLLQPLVENSVAHGLRDREEGGEVRVSARLEEGEAILSVSDTGDGMSEEEARRLLGSASAGGDPREGAPRDGGIGLWNVIRRVTLATEGRGRVELESAPGAGTSVTIRIPAGGLETGGIS
jgi:sensor histidine kinase YesM